MPGALTTPDDIPAAEAVERLRAAMVYYQNSPGPVAEHRLFGALSKTEWDRLVCVHSAHHLSFALPQAS